MGEDGPGVGVLRKEEAERQAVKRRRPAQASKTASKRACHSIQQGWRVSLNSHRVAGALSSAWCSRADRDSAGTAVGLMCLTARVTSVKVTVHDGPLPVADHGQRSMGWIRVPAVRHRDQYPAQVRHDVDTDAVRHVDLRRYGLPGAIERTDSMVGSDNPSA